MNVRWADLKTQARNRRSAVDCRWVFHRTTREAALRAAERLEGVDGIE